MCGEQSKVADISLKQPMLIVFYTVLILLSLGIANLAFAGNPPPSLLYDPMRLGPYAIGHTDTIFTDLSRNRDGSTPATPPAQGRPLYVSIWYPLQNACKNCQLTQYSLNNPIYDGTHTGYPQLSLPTVFPTDNGTVENGVVNSGVFPLVMVTHGSGASANFGVQTIAETLASHGYIVASVEHTGNNFIRAAAISGGLAGGPSMSAGVPRMLRRSQDISFVIGQMLSNSSNPVLSSHINANAIGLFGYSLGGGTTMLTVAGLQAAGLAPDTRVKAAIPMDGTDYVGFIASDYANVHVPLMLYQDSNSGENARIFPQLVNSPLKYFVDIAGAQHIPAQNLEYCSELQSALSNIEANPNDALIVGNGIYLVSLRWGSNGFQFCPASVYNGISDTTLSLIGLDPIEVAAMKPLMPLRTATPLSEFNRMDKWYIVSFFNKTLKNQNGYDIYLNDSLINRIKNPLVEFSKNCRYRADHPMDLQPGDMITFTPLIGKVYLVSMSHGNALLDKGTNNLNLGDDDSADIALPFSFSMPNTGPFNHIKVNSNGAIVVSSLINSNIDLGFDYSSDSPWMMRGEVMLNGQPTITPLRNDFDPTAHGGVYAKVEDNRVIVTWDAVPMYTAAGNGDQSTMQVVINKNGVINLIYGVMAQTGPDYQPDYIGTIGVSTGENLAIEVQTDLVDFSKLKQPVILPGAFEQFYLGTGGAPCSSN